jgi:hypothetical protein
LLIALQSFTAYVPLAGHFLMQLEADLHGLENIVSVRPYDVQVGYNKCHVVPSENVTDDRFSIRSVKISHLRLNTACRKLE